MSSSVFGVCGVRWLRYNDPMVVVLGSPWKMQSDCPWLGYGPQWVCVWVCSVVATVWGTHMRRWLLGCMQICWSVGGFCWPLGLVHWWPSICALGGGWHLWHMHLWATSTMCMVLLELQEASAIFCGLTAVASCWGICCPPQCCTPWK